MGTLAFSVSMVSVIVTREVVVIVEIKHTCDISFSVSVVPKQGFFFFVY